MNYGPEFLLFVFVTFYIKSFLCLKLIPFFDSRFIPIRLTLYFAAIVSVFLISIFPETLFADLSSMQLSGRLVFFWSQVFWGAFIGVVCRSFWDIIEALFQKYFNLVVTGEDLQISQYIFICFSVALLGLGFHHFLLSFLNQTNYISLALFSNSHGFESLMQATIVLIKISAIFVFKIVSAFLLSHIIIAVSLMTIRRFSRFESVLEVFKPLMFIGSFSTACVTIVYMDFLGESFISGVVKVFSVAGMGTSF